MPKLRPSSPRPSKPSPPKEPVRPEKVVIETFKPSIAVYDGMSMQMALDEAIKTSARMARDGHRPIPPTLDQLKLGVEHQYGDDTPCIVLEWDQVVEVTRSDQLMTELLITYEGRMVRYRESVAAYEASLIDYERDLAAWTAVEAEATKARDLATLTALRAKYPEVAS